MLDLFVFLFAVTLGGGGEGDDTALAGTDEMQAGAAPAYVAEPQTPSGKFTTATEVRPILTATKGNWVAVREYDGRDLVYVTHLLAWRCGLVGMRYGINGEQMRDWPMPDCLTEYATPNALPDGVLPFVSFAPGSVRSVQIEIIYDDLGRDAASFKRNEVLIP